jgi:hypothetical protein
MHRMSTLLAVAAAIAVAGCGSSDEVEDPFAGAKAFLAETAYLPSYQRCVIREGERLATPAELRRIDGLPEEQSLKAGIDILEPATVKCKEDARGPIIDPQATSAELAPLKELSAQAFALGAVEGGATRAQADCLERRVNAMSDAEMIEFGNTTGARAQEKVVLPVLESCLGT